MLVQDRSSVKSATPNNLRSHSSPQNRERDLDLLAWFSENLYKVVLISLLIVTVALLVFIRGGGNDVALMCIESRSEKFTKIAYPEIRWNSITSIPDKSSPYASFRSDRWIIVSVTTYPTDSLRNLVKIKNWQVLAIGTSKTPKDWDLKGAIFLSLEQQANLGFRILDFLPFDSYVRKSVGYLFAIQHGAKKIFDADDRGDVIDGDLAKHFDIELVGEDAKLHTLLQYSHENPNRTVVNPYIHFGQRSVWPRGLPLKNVGELGNEEFYTEVYSGKQYIQQGISNGLPDVDSIFYFTRKSAAEAFDIRFDEKAPKIAFPQGVMVPVNSFNTIFHSSAFWGLMLPVSVSSMASDILRGYWAQRLLWEIGGFIVVYPPTVHRNDRIEAYPFSEEKDLHVNVDRLIRFLISWRSNEWTLFEKILHLSHSMAEDGFWTEKDVRSTAAWLQDLLAVGYQQPRLMSLELGRPLAAIGHGDRKEFIPRKLPSVHLGVKETGTVNYEIGNLIRWRKIFGNIVLIMHCNEKTLDRTTLEWRLLYGRIFKTVVILSENNNTDLAVEREDLWQAYKYLPKIFARYTSADGFIFLQDDTVLNYWNLLESDKTKLWITNKVSNSWITIPQNNRSEWISTQADMLSKVVQSMPVHFQVSYKGNVNEGSLILCGSEVFYVPQNFVSDLTDLVELIGDLQMHHKIAVPMIFMAMDSLQNFDSSAFKNMIYETDQISGDSSKSYSHQVPAFHPWKVLNETDFIKLIRTMGAGDPLLLELV